MEPNLEGSPDRRPCFYKIIWVDNLLYVQIPPDFKKHLTTDAQINGVTLKTGAGKWDLKLLRDEEGDMFLFQGWKEFAEHHSLGSAEALFFKYNGDMSFDVVIYDKNGCIKKYTSVETSHQTLSFGSVLPFFKYKIKGYNVGTKCSLPIPLDFSRRHLPASKQMMFLQNSENVCWQVNINLSGTSRLIMYGGWKAFSDSNSIKKDDICIFELVEKNVMQVHIFK